MPGIGSIRIDIVANTAEFVRSLDNAEKRVRRWGRAAADAINDADRAFSALGGKLTAKVTAPLIALGVAAVKAADPTKKLSNEMESLGLRATQALRPLGNVIADVLNEARPTIYRAIGVVNALTEAFEDMSPRAQRVILGLAGVAAAIGPTLLALSALTSGAKFAAEAISLMYNATGSLLRVLWLSTPALAKFALVAATAAAAFDLGNRIYNSFETVQTGLAKFIAYNQNAAELVRYAWDVAVENISLTFRKFVAETIGDRTVSSFLSAVFSATGQASAAAMLQALGGADAARGETFSALNARLAATHAGNVANIDAALAVQLDQIRKDFAGRSNGDPGPNTILEDMLAKIGRIGEISAGAFAPMVEAFDRIAARSKEIGAAGPTILSPTQLQQASDQVKATVSYLEKLQSEAMQVHLEVYPQEQYDKDLSRLRELRKEWPTVIDDEAFAAKVQRIRDQFVALEAANGRLWARMELTVRGFADDMGDWFASMVMTGRQSFNQILKSWTATLLAMVSKTAIFEPLARAIGTGISGLIGPPSAASGYHTTSGYNNASSFGARGTTALGMGGVFDHGLLRRFAAGTVLTGPSYFQTRDGRPNVAGEAGPEGILPLERIGGKLGVNATGGVTVNVFNQTNSQVGVEQSRGPDGGQVIDLMITQAVNAGLNAGRFDEAMRRNYATSRVGVRR